MLTRIAGVLRVLGGANDTLVYWFPRLTLERTRADNRRVARRPTLPRAFTDRLLRPGGRPEEWFLGELQAQVLHTLSRRGPSRVRDVVGALPGRPRLAYTTVMTVLDKLHNKGLVRRAREGKGYVYESRYRPEELRDHMARYLVSELVDDFGDVALAHFAGALDGVDRRRLEKLRGRR